VDTGRLLARPLLLAGAACVPALLARLALPASIASPGALVVFGVVYSPLAAAYLARAAAIRNRPLANADASS